MAVLTQNGAVVVTSDPVDLLDVVWNGGMAQRRSDGALYINSAPGSTFVQYVSAPATSSSTGTAGQIASNGTYLYVCVAANSWRRVLMETF